MCFSEQELQNSTEPASKPKVFVAASHTSALPALLIDAVFIIAVSIVSQVGYSLAAFGIVGDLHRAFCVGAVIAITFCGTTRLSATEQTSRASQWWERGRRAVAAWQRLLKRGFDIFVSTSFLLFLLPVFVIIAVAIKLDSPGAIIFAQVRRGCGGRLFHIFKFRTMSVSEDGSDVVQARKVDDRVTRLGAWLRRWSLDELPQFVNVLLGDMSLVGPRPHAIAHDDHYAKLIENYELRQHVKPGITGWAQVHGQRGETATVEAMLRRIESDLWYSANCSILLDLRILLRTLIVVIRRVNAY